MSKLFIRHGLQKAESPLYSEAGPPLSAEGRRQAMQLRGTLADMGVQLDRVAVSGRLRAQETAEIAGARSLVVYESLNEVPHAVPGQALQAMVETGQLPDSALKAGQAIYESPPEEDVVFSHGLVIAGLIAITRIKAGLPLVGHPLRLEPAGIREVDL